MRALRTSTGVLSLVKSAASAVVGRPPEPSRDAVTRLMGPGDLGQVLQPFLVLDQFDGRDAPFGGCAWCPISGLASLTYVFEGGVNVQDSSGLGGLLRAGGLAWLRAGRGAWHTLGASGPAPARGFRLQVALPPDLELGPSACLYRRASEIPTVGPARVLLGDHQGVTGPIPPPTSMTCLAVRLMAGERWTYVPPRGHRVLWVAVSRGALRGASAGEIVVLAAAPEPIEFLAEGDADFVLGSAFPQPYDLFFGRHAAHTSPRALAEGEAEIARQRSRLKSRGVTG